MKKLIVLGLGLLLTLNPLTVNANDDYEPWQQELLDRANLHIQPHYYNEIQEIDGQYYLYEIIEAYTTDWYLVTGWSISSNGYFRTNDIDIPIPVHNDYSYRRLDISSNLLSVGSVNTLIYNNNDLTFTVNQFYSLTVRNNQITTIFGMQQYLNDNNFTIYYKLDETRLTLLDWYDPTTTPDPTPSNYTYLLVPSLLAIIGAMIYIDRKYLKEEY